MKMSDAQFNKLADIFANLGLIFIGSIIVPVLLEKFDVPLLITAGLASIIFWVLSLLVVR